MLNDVYRLWNAGQSCRAISRRLQIRVAEVRQILAYEPDPAVECALRAIAPRDLERPLAGDKRSRTKFPMVCGPCAHWCCGRNP